MKSKIRSSLVIDPQDIGLLSLRKTWQSVGAEKSSAWTTIYSYITGEGFSVVFSCMNEESVI